MTADEFRRLALRLPGAEEHAHQGHPDFRLGGKVFATLAYPDDEHAMVKLTPEHQEKYLRFAPSTFRAATGAWGRNGCTLVHLPTAASRFVADALLSAHAKLAAVAPVRRAKTTAKGRP